MTSAPDLTRIDRVLRGALAETGVDWTPPLQIGAPGLVRSINAFGLSPFEADVLLLALAPEIDDRYAAAFAALNRSSTLARPTAGLAARLLTAGTGASVADAIAALGPVGRLSKHGLVRLSGDGPHATRSLALPTPVWMALVDDRPPDMLAFAAARAPLDALVLQASTLERAEHAIFTARALPAAAAWIAVHGPYSRSTVAEAIAAALGQRVLVAPADPARIAELARDARWWNATIVTELGWPSPDLLRLAREASTPLISIIDGSVLRELVDASGRTMIDVQIDELDLVARRELWTRMLPELAGESAALAARYRFGPGRVRSTATLARARADARGSQMTLTDVAEACRASANSSTLVRRLDLRAHVEAPVLPPKTRRELELLEAAARHGPHVFGPGGTGARIPGAGGLVALFAGPPGTGKTMSVQVIAERLELDVLRIDLSQVVNKYIGETEKHLDQVFREGDEAGAILFFDEADALFGKRTEVRDAHDRYANLETAFLLQRLEQHRGIAILATNLKHNLDAAFMRRIQLVVEFEIPGLAEREAIWNHLVTDALGDDVDLAFLAGFALAGGDIRNAATSAILLAARAGTPVSMQHLVIGTWRELRKAGRLIAADEFGIYRDTVLGYAGFADQHRPA